MDAGRSTDTGGINCNWLK